MYPYTRRGRFIPARVFTPFARRTTIESRNQSSIIRPMKNPGAPADCPCLTMMTRRRSVLKGAAGALLEMTLLRVTTFAQDDPQSIRPRPGDLDRKSVV